MSRGSASVLMLLLGVVLALAGGVLSYVRSEVLDEDAFADRAVTTLHDDAVRGEIAHEVSVQLLRSSGFVEVPPPQLEAVVDRAIRTPTFERAFRAAAKETHTALFDREEPSVFFDVPNAGRALARALRSVAPGLADQVPVRAEARLLEIERQSFGVRALRAVDDLGPLGPVLLLVGIALLAGSLAIAPDPRVALVRAGLAAAGASALLWVALQASKELVAAGASTGYALAGDDVRPAVKGIWSAYAGDLATWTLVVTGLGLAAAAAGWLAGRRSRRVRHAV